MGDHGSGVCETNSDLVSGAVFPEIKEDIGSPEGHVQQSCEVVDGPRVPEVTELQGGLIGDADERVPLLLAPPGEGGPHHAEVREAQTAEGGVLRSLGLEQDSARVGSEPGAQVFG